MLQFFFEPQPVGEEDFLAIFEISYFRAIAKNFFFCQS